MKISEVKLARRKRRRNSVRRRIAKTGCGTRLSVHRTSKHIYVQIVDDREGKTLCAAGTTAKGLSKELGGKSKTERASLIGAEIARKAKDAGVERVVFDRGSARFHGRVKALAEAAREVGLKF